MDKLKEFFGLLRRQHFWFIAPLLLVIGLVGWTMANKQLTEQFEAGKNEVQTYISQMQSVSGQQPHPNPDYEAGMSQLIAQRRDNVRAAWERKWEKQRKELVWPEGLDADFVRLVDPMRPIEKEDPNRPEISAVMRRGYQSFIKELLPRMATRIGAKWEPATTGGVRPSGFDGRGSSSGEPRSTGRGRADSGMGEEEPALVQWNPENQGQIADRFDWGNLPPSTLEVLYAQEDLWVLTTLMDIIQRTNGDAVIRSQAAIKVIDFIQIGKDVEPPSRQGFNVVRPIALGDSDEASGPANSAPANDEPDATVDSSVSELTIDGPDGTVPDPKLQLAMNRYYDINYEPIADLQSSSMKVAKRIPVRLRLRMDQRKINELLVQCANAPLTFEVRQLRFNPQIGQSGSPGDGPLRGEATFSAFGAARTAAKVLDDYESLDRTIELFGIVYIFNPVDNAVLDGDLDGASAQVDDSTARMPVDRWRPEGRVMHR